MDGDSVSPADGGVETANVSGKPGHRPIQKYSRRTSYRLRSLVAMTHKPNLTADILAHRRAKIESQLTLGDAQIRCPHCNGINRNDGEYVSGRRPGDPLCCDVFTEDLFSIITRVDGDTARYPGRVRQAADMIEVKNLLYVESQVRALMRNASGVEKSDIAVDLGQQILWCPYCRLGNKFGNPELCCFDLGEAVAGVLAKMEIQRQIDEASRITENADKLNACGVTVN